MARISVRITPRSNRAEIAGQREGTYLLKVTSPPVEGQANDACVRLLADALDVAPSSIRIVTGRSSRSKVIEVEGLEREEIERRLSGSR